MRVVIHDIIPGYEAQVWCCDPNCENLPEEHHHFHLTSEGYFVTGLSANMMASNQLQYFHCQQFIGRNMPRASSIGAKKLLQLP